MKKQNTSSPAEASATFNVNPLNFPLHLPMIEMILQTKAKIEPSSTQAGFAETLGLHRLGLNHQLRCSLP